MKLTRYFIAISLSLILSLSPFSYQSFIVHSDDDYDSLTGYNEWNTDKTVSKSVYIEPGATLVIKKGVTITFEGLVYLGVGGKLEARGTVKDPIKFRFQQTGNGSPYSSFYSVVISGGEAIFRNVDISGGGEYDSGPPPIPVGKIENKFINKAYAYDPNPTIAAISFMGGKLEVDHCNFHDNKFGLYIGETSLIGDNFKINRSKFQNNLLDVVSRAIGSPDFRYNFWGQNGPDWNKIWGDIDSSDWTSEENKKDPVVIIPGILGSQKINGEWVLDPILHSYDDLYKEFKDDGYEEGKNLFAFPYEWRDSNVTNAQLLEARISEIKQNIHWPKVDIVAHSMGGLLAREYIESDYYQNDVDQLVTLGTPHNGAPIDYLTWEGGNMGAPDLMNITGLLAEKVFKQEAKENGYQSIFEYVRKRPIKSVQDLLPVYDYLYSISDNSMRIYPNLYPTNNFLENLNSLDNISKLNKIEFNNIIGNLSNKESTVTGIRVGDPLTQSNLMWEHGFPENYDSLLGDHGLQNGEGDGTVPLKSSGDITSDEKIIEENISHGDLPAKSLSDIIKILIGSIPEHQINYTGITKILGFFVFSPIDIQVVDKNGHRVGKDFATGKIINEIPGAYYSGFDTDNEFLTIPNPEDGEYRIITQGTGGGGEYKIEATKISEDVTQTQGAIESTAEITGTSVPEEQKELAVEVSGDKIEITESMPEKVDINTIISDVGKYYNSGLITKKATKLVLEAKLRIIKNMMSLLDRTQKSKLPAKAKNKVVENLKRQINREINQLISQIQNPKNLGRNISIPAREELVNNLEKLKL